MKFIRRLQFAVIAFATFAIPGSVSAAAVISQTYTGTFPATITGTLPNQGTALEETITLPATSSLTLFTTSYATGGFEPNILIFNSTGNFVAASGAQGSPPLSTADLDAYLSVSNLMAGQYTIALTDLNLNQSLTATNLSDGFTQNYGDGVNFVDQNGLTRTGSYSLTADISQTPEPSSWLLIAPVFLISLLYKHLRNPLTK